MPLRPLSKLLPIGLCHEVVKCLARLDVPDGFENVHLVHDLDPLDEVV